MLEKINELLKNQTTNLNKDEKLKYLNALGYKNWRSVLEASEDSIGELLAALKNNALVNKVVDLSGARYMVTYPKGNREVKNVHWSNKEIERYLNAK